ncbi:unnamed protein product [Acanthoscelides obtectus]|uniref:Uncharacterized protein n=1 Tax=Acanthoscelides obtectus TaxID=200917 RepID=A0A9P0PBM0_ACAOB|nr:unnamed protein product [Acanthoscelides obtectus]CAK1641857.1 hypothetical protein AOBTE_LOCUS12683 [Acanthoscelides obtectus]
MVAKLQLNLALCAFLLWLHCEGVSSELLRPTVSRSEARKICVELCSSGLGGHSCGDDCVDLTPADLPVAGAAAGAAPPSGAAENNETRVRDEVCDMLCLNGLGKPLCKCPGGNWRDDQHRPNFIQICSFYCLHYNYQLNGCQSCEAYATASEFSKQSLVLESDPKVNWPAWCVRKCHAGDGGAACECDLLPMGLITKK